MTTTQTKHTPEPTVRFAVHWTPYHPALRIAQANGYKEGDSLWVFVDIGQARRVDYFSYEGAAKVHAKLILQKELDALGAVHIHREIFVPGIRDTTPDTWEEDGDYADNGYLEICAGDVAANAKAEAQS